MKKVRQWSDLICAEATRFGIDPDLVAAVVQVESRGNPKAHSGSDARGLMQIVPKWHPNCKGDLYDPQTNLRCGVKILAGHVKKYGIRGGLARYYGVGKEATQTYVRLVMKLYNSQE